MNVYGPINSGVAAGGAGVATNNANSTHVITGRVVGIYLRYNDAPPAATTDVIIKTLGTDPSIPTYTLLTRTDSATDGLYLVRATPCGVTGVALAALTVLEPWPVADFVNVLIQQANNGDSVDAWLLIE